MKRFLFLACFALSSLCAFAQAAPGDTLSTAAVGQTVTHTVTVANGASNLSYQWFFNNGVTNVALTDTAAGVLPSITGSTNFRLVIGKVTAASAGTYTVKVSNSTGSALSNNAVVTVVPPGPAGVTITSVVSG